MFEARIYISLKRGILDLEGKTVNQSLKSLGYDQVEDVKTGKYLVLTLSTADQAAAEQAVQEMCEKLLVNKVMEEYTFELREVAE
ncbi:MAG TPA: phosphoribosylformylglycinamidine synthase subunit PurS [Syntrophomonadaceae bacterium]|nr:phosphoribosylformylglycinamidine synthase subunit PurS [Syntrophomonadaceae bacterium]